ncbi:uncharacterized protein LOC143186784 [Calliopsis andreniformis]|uniref:uncharacterized protein LOC143186784 n=1 Tax=Calliopsis andreniformis TaxID=337506 RepID=UPI003FCD36D4
MAKRKSLLKRLSRDSRYSIGSGILDADTDNLGDEYTYWWKHLENNTIARSSVGPNTLYETSRQLDSNSIIDTNDVEDQWWKRLEATDLNSQRFAAVPAKQDKVINIVSTSESEEEIQVAKRKLLLRSKARKAQAKTFENALNSSVTSVISEPASKSAERDHLAKSVPCGSISDTEQFQKASLDGSHKVSAKNHTAQHRNVFDDVLKENNLSTPSKRRSLRAFALNNSQTLNEKNILEATKSPIIKQGGSHQLISSFENEYDLSQLPVPEAQSTLVETYTTSMQSINNSDTQTIVKAKAKLLRRQNKSTKKNIFEDILAEEEVNNAIEINKSQSKNIVTNADVSKKSLPPNETKNNNAQMKQSTNVGKFVDSDKKSVDATSTSSSTSSIIDHNINNFVKPRSKFLQKSRKRQKRNLFQDILMEDDDIETSKKPRYKNTICSSSEETDVQPQHSPEKTSTRESADKGTHDYSGDAEASKSGSKTPKSLENNSKSSQLLDVSKTPNRSTANSFRNINEIHKRNEIAKAFNKLRAEESQYESDDSNQEDEHTERRESRNQSKLKEQLSHSVVEGLKQNDASKMLHRQSENLDKEEKRSTLSVTKETQVKEVLTTPKRQDISRLQGEVSPAKNDGTSNKVEDTTTRQSKSANSLRRWITLIDTSESEAEKDEDIPESQNMVSRKSQRQDSPETNEIKSTEIDSPIRRQGRSLSKSKKRSTLVTSESEAEEEKTPERPSRVLRTSQMHLIFKTNETESEELNSPIQRQSRSLSKSKNRSALIMSESEVEEEKTPKKSSRVLRRSQRQDSPGANEIKSTEIDSPIRRQGRSLSKSKKRSTLVTSESEAEEEKTPERPSRVLRTSQMHLISKTNETESEELNSPIQRQSRSLSKSKNRSALIMSESEVEEEKTPKKSSRVLRRSQRQDSPGANEIKSTEIDSPIRRQSKSLSKSKKRLTLVMSESEKEEKTPERPSRVSRTSQMHLTSKTNETESEELNSPIQRQSRSLSKSKNRSALIMSESEVEEEKTPKRSSRVLRRSQRQNSPGANEIKSTEIDSPIRRQSKSLSKSKKRLTLVMSESEKEEKTPERPSRVSRTSQMHLTLKTNEIETKEFNNPIQKQSRSLSKSKNQLTLIMSDCETEEGKTPGRPSTVSRTSQMHLTPKTTEIESKKLDSPVKRQSKSLSKSKKRSTLGGVSEPEAVEILSTPKRQSRISGMSFKQISSVDNEVELEQTENIPTKQSRSSSKSQNQPILRITNEFEVEDIQTTPKRQLRSSSRSHRRPDLAVDSSDKTENQSTPKRQSRTSHKSEIMVSPTTNEVKSDEIVIRQQSRSLNVLQSSQGLERRSIMSSTDDSKTKEDQGIQRRQIRSLSRLEKQVTSTKHDVESNEIDNATSRSRNLNTSAARDVSDTKDSTKSPKRPERTSSRLRKHSGLDADESKQKKDESTMKKRSESISKSKSQISPIKNNVTKDKLDNTRQSKASKTQKWLNLIVSSDSEEESILLTSNKQSRSSNKLKEQSGVADQPDTERSQDTLKKRSVSQKLVSIARSEAQNESQKRSTLNVPIDLELDDVQRDVQEQSRGSRSLGKSVSLTVDGSGSDGRRLIEEQENSPHSKTTEETTRLLNTNTVQDNVDTGKSDLSNTQKQSNIIESQKQLVLILDRIDRKEHNPSSPDRRESKKDTPISSRSKGTPNKNASASKRASTAKALPRTDKNQNVDDSPRKLAVKLIPLTRISKTGSTGQRNIMDFLSKKELVPVSQIAATQKSKIEEIKQDFQKVKERGLDVMKPNHYVHEANLSSKDMKEPENFKKITKLQKQRRPEQIHKAFLVNGQAYKVPRLPRTKSWVTDRLYNHLWKRMEPKYKLESRVMSTKFVRQLTDVTAFIQKEKSYSRYKMLLHALMKEMARLGVIQNRYDFYNFCQEFLPYELRSKMVPMLLPGNVRNIPYDPNNLYEPIP